MFAVDLARARAWLVAAQGELSAAVAENGVYGLEVLALHDVARFGRAADVADRLEARTELVDGSLVRGVAAHARALADGDGVSLDAVSHRFSSLTLDLFAMEASAAASRMHRRNGKRASAFAAQERARELGAHCDSPQTPSLNWADQPEDLTAREREVADLAATNLASREIAERLGITTRTVDNLLGRVYAKLGLSGRQDLTDLLRSRRTL
jgi:DNA-binding CsgD family transcriptional regulator